MIGALLDRLLLGLGLGRGGRIDLLNLAHNRAANLWPHRLAACATALLALVLGTGMAQQWRDMNAHRPGAGKSASNMRDELDKTRADIAAAKLRIDPKKAQALGAGVREANLLIMQRALAPTDMLGDLEAVKPFGGRLIGLRRVAVPGGATLLSFRLKAPQRKIYEEFAARIGRARRFSGLSLKSEATQNGDFDADVEMLWTPVGPAETTELPPAADKAVTRSGGSAPAAAAVPAVNAAPPAARAAPAPPPHGTAPNSAPRTVIRMSRPPASPHSAAERPAAGSARPAPPASARSAAAPAGKPARRPPAGPGGPR